MMGMEKIRRGKEFINVLNYAFENNGGQKPGRLIGGNMIYADARNIAKEFEVSKRIRPEIEKPVWHNSLRLAAGERISDEKWEKIADDYMKKMGFNDFHQRAYIIHDDEDGQHIHIIASRISLKSDLYLGKNENLESTTQIRKLEKKYRLSEFVENNDPDKIRRKPTSVGEKGRAIRTGKMPVRMMIQTIIDDASADKPCFSDFINRLAESAVSVIPAGKSGPTQGISFGFDSQVFKGSKLGKSYAWAGLQRRIDYDIDRDQDLLDRLRRLAEQDEEEENGHLVPLSASPPEPRRRHKRTLELTLDKIDASAAAGITYNWKSSGRVALIDNGDKITLMSNTDSIVRASLQLSRDKGWTSVKAVGTEEFKRKTWLVGNELGIEIQGYTPSLEDIEELDLILKNKNKEAKNGKNRRNETESDSGGFGEKGSDRLSEDSRSTERSDIEFEFSDQEDPAPAPARTTAQTAAAGTGEAATLEDFGDRSGKAVSDAVSALFDIQHADRKENSSLGDSDRDERSAVNERSIDDEIETEVEERDDEGGRMGM